MKTINNHGYEAVGIANPDFTIAQLCEGAQAWMFPRELIKNALEATEKFILNKEIEKPVDILVRAMSVDDLLTDSDGTDIIFTQPKLSILNFGGMSENELYDATRMASSVGKTQGSKNNYGIGMKVTIAKWSDILYITRKNGKSHLCVLGIRNGQLVRILPVTPCNRWVNEMSFKRFYPETHDFTEVVLLGLNWKTQNTLTHPYGAEKNKSLFITSIFRRFVNVPENIRIVFQSGKDSESTPALISFKQPAFIFKTWNEAFEKNKTKDSFYNSITTKDGKIIHFYYDPPNQTNGNPITQGTTTAMNGQSTFSALIFGEKDHEEYFDVREGIKWRSVASRLGIISGFEYFRVFVELPYSLYRQTWSRDSLVKEGDNDVNKIEFTDFIADIRETMPSEIKQKISEHNSAAQKESLDDILREKLMEYQDLLTGGRVALNNKQSKKGPLSEVFPNRAANTNVGTHSSSNDTKKKVDKKSRESLNSKYSEDQENNLTADIPEILQATENMINEHEMTRTFARFLPEGGEGGLRDRVLINTGHEVVDYLLSKVSYDPDVEHLVRKTAIRLLEIKIAMTIIMAKADMRNAESIFSKEDFNAMTKDSVLTLQARQCIDQLGELNSEIRSIEKQSEAGVILEKTFEMA